MKNLIKNRLLRRFGPAKRLTDVALVGGAALKLAQRKGLVSEDTAKKFGASTSSGGTKLSIGEIVLLAGALIRLIKRMWRGDAKKIVIEV